PERCPFTRSILMQSFDCAYEDLRRQIVGGIGIPCLVEAIPIDGHRMPLIQGSEVVHPLQGRPYRRIVIRHPVVIVRQSEPRRLLRIILSNPGTEADEPPSNRERKTAPGGRASLVQALGMSLKDIAFDRG